MIKTHGDFNQRTCQVCNKEFPKLEDLIVHMQAHNGYTPFQCNFCQTNFKSLSELQEHVKTEHEKKSEKAVKMNENKETADVTAKNLKLEQL